MHRIGDKVMYGASGVMTIVDIREESIGDVSRRYYVLRPTLSKSESFTFVPADNEKLASNMRPLLTKDEIMAFLRGANNITPVEWIKENRRRQDFFKKIMESGDREQMIAMILAIEANASRREAEGKECFLSDENAKQKAKRLLYSEVAVVLGIPEEEVGAFVKKETV